MVAELCLEVLCAEVFLFIYWMGYFFLPAALKKYLILHRAKRQHWTEFLMKLH